MENLPEELWSAIVEVSPVPVLKSLRLVSRRLHQRATPELFHTIFLCPYLDSFQRMLRISFDRRLREYVKRIIYDAAMLPGCSNEVRLGVYTLPSGEVESGGHRDDLFIQYLEEQASLVSRWYADWSTAPHYLTDAFRRLPKLQELAIIYDGTKGQHAEVFRATGVAADPKIGLENSSSHVRSLARAEREFSGYIGRPIRIKKVTLPLMYWTKLEVHPSDNVLEKYAYTEIYRLIRDAEIVNIGEFRYDDKVEDLLTARTDPVSLIPFLLLNMRLTTHLKLHLQSVVEVGSGGTELYPLSLMVNQLEAPPAMKDHFARPFMWSIQHNKMKHAELSGLQGSWEELISLVEQMPLLEYLAISTITEDTIPEAEFGLSGELFLLEYVRRRIPQTLLTRLILNQHKKPPLQTLEGEDLQTVE